MTIFRGLFFTNLRNPGIALTPPVLSFVFSEPRRLFRGAAYSSVYGIISSYRKIICKLSQGVHFTKKFLVLGGGYRISQNNSCKGIFPQIISSLRSETAKKVLASLHIFLLALPVIRFILNVKVQCTVIYVGAAGWYHEFSSPPLACSYFCTPLICHRHFPVSCRVLPSAVPCRPAFCRSGGFPL